MKRKTYLLSTTAIIFISLGLYHVWLSFSESLDFNKYSWAYFTLLAKEVRDLPLYEPIDGSLSYGYRTGDGLPEINHSVSYETQLIETILLDNYSAYFSNLDLSKERYSLSSNKYLFDGPKGAYIIYTDTSTQHQTYVFIDFVEKTGPQASHPLKDR